MASPYHNQTIENWEKITRYLINEHPLTESQIIQTVLLSWEQIIKSKIGALSIGKQILPTPQIMSTILHELIPYNLAENICNDYRVGDSKLEKDIVYVPDNKYSIEVKASSSKYDIYANRSYAQPSTDPNSKDKNGYYIGVNFEIKKAIKRRLHLIRIAI